MAHPTDLIFKMEHQFTLYLQRGGVTREKLPPDQLREMRRAFYGGLGQMFFLMTQDLASLKQRDQVPAMEKIQEQIGQFWEVEQALYSGELQALEPTTPVKCVGCEWEGITADLIKPVESVGMCKCPKCKGVELFYPSW